MKNLIKYMLMQARLSFAKSQERKWASAGRDAYKYYLYAQGRECEAADRVSDIEDTLEEIRDEIIGVNA